MAHGFTTETNPEMAHDLRKDRELSDLGLDQYTQTLHHIQRGYHSAKVILTTFVSLWQKIRCILEM